MVQVVDPEAALRSPLWPLLVDPQTGEWLAREERSFWALKSD